MQIHQKVVQNDKIHNVSKSDNKPHLTFMLTEKYKKNNLKPFIF